MDKLVIRGGHPLQGTIRISGAKNAALPTMAACLLTAEEVTLKNIPDVRDIQTTRRLLEAMGVESEGSGGHHRISLRARTLSHPQADYELVKTMRASTLVLGPLLARTGAARVSLPGGCAIGARPIDLHLKGLERLGANLRQEHGYVVAEAKRLQGNSYTFDRVTVTGTEDVLMAAVLARGETLLHNCAQEPEVVDLAALLVKMGARIEGAGSPTLRIQGVDQLGGASHTIIADRIEAGTFLIAALITGGALELTHCQPEHLDALVERLGEVGAHITSPSPTSLRVARAHPLRAVDVSTAEYPGFATDLQAQYLALMTQADGAAVVTETIFENRFMHALELNRMGASIRIEGSRAIVRGPSPLAGAAVQASDLRASASLVLAALAADGETIIDRIYHLDRGYEKLEDKLRGVGAAVRRLGRLIPLAPQAAAAPSQTS
ncbi:MAG TPA: UDP-N-acetylglucosamine 1-carboxyvinyltransferase [Terriglobales bacterium]|nr:UDP-N-acetylglucosamine 1-carboxyvinyltransferase [Terriglobales bacterium]